MKNSKIKTIIKIIFTILQVLILIPPIVLQYFSDKKMGVKRYLVFKKAMFSKETFNSNNLYMLKVMLIIGIAICIVLLAYYSFRKINKPMVKSLLKLILLNIAVMSLMFSKQLQESLVYHFYIIAALVVVILQYIKAILDYKR